MLCREILALPRRALQRAGLDAVRPPADYNLPRGKPLPRVRYNRHLDIHQQEMYKDSKSCDFGVSMSSSAGIESVKLCCVVIVFLHHLISSTL